MKSEEWKKESEKSNVYHSTSDGGNVVISNINDEILFPL